MERIDCHCHIFNMLTIGWRVLLEQFHHRDIPTDERMPDRGVLDKIGKIAALIRAFTGDSEHIFRQLDKAYRKKYRMFALMFDGDFLLDAATKKQLQDISREVSSSLDQRRSPVEGDAEVNQSSAERSMETTGNRQAVLDFLDELAGTGRELRADHRDGFTVQFEAIEQLASDPRFKERLLPFLAVDPRREGIKDYLERVGNGKLFAGIKVYPPNGFSPYDPVLTGPGSVFDYCATHGIPVVSHCSYGGFATPVKRLDVNGLIMTEGENQPKEFQGEYTFETGIKDGFGDMVKERAAVLNHPKIWAKVLEQHKDLNLVLAHFGVGSNEWQDEILALLYRFDNLYTDVSCISEELQLLRVKSIYEQNPEIRSKILYGSDFFLDLLFNDSFQQYKKRMELIFGRKMFDQLSIHNPAGFMEKWYIE
ncbi:MAG TPA: amidohydrolase family protein [Prolixibacteraceae bacterium]|nr:amidohydrolase family protein [Prolixibacteraceae bacterium]